MTDEERKEAERLASDYFDKETDPGGWAAGFEIYEAACEAKRKTWQTNTHELAMRVDVERARSAKLIEALKFCQCVGKNGTPHFNNIGCLRCDAIAEYEAGRD